MITLSQFLDAVQANAARITHYQLGGDGRDGGCDCIGLIIGAVRLAGGTWTGTHGSNWAARKMTRDLHQAADERGLWLGAIVYKARKPGDEKYDLPAAYADSPDQLDYYHVGVVTRVDPLEITHCTGVPGGIKRDSTQGAWKYAGDLTCVEYDAAPQEEPLYLAAVWAENGYPVKMRRGPDTGSQVLERLDVGTVVEVLDVLDGWSQIRHGGMTGYMMNAYLREIRETEQITVEREDLQAIYEGITYAAEVLRKLLEG